ncbi:MAG: hypothetical protein J6U87_03115 [Clostridia bacterium]|nr:hypothetical protein [Clostridia bacterium]
MRKFLLVLLALALCLSVCLCFSSCTKEISEESWRAAFAFENVRVDCTRQPWNEEALTSEPLYGGTHYLFDGELAAVANAEVWLIGQSTPVLHEKHFTERRRLTLLFDFADYFEEFTLLEDGRYFCEKSSLKSIMWENDRIEDVYVTFTDGQVSEITYAYYGSNLSPATKTTLTFSEYGQVVLETPAE